ncbi:Lrp/AsnC family transcriptional regulator [Amycolatopsis acidiphila]|uniref:Lrp/AsnC family transcriptional regulator n=1 Tax=Amycolatopsis acidiphila TaxID=715473 RepID=A0A557ZYT8_9PSEU|nr:Lrp/AsnC family transcriptional regulator [Amycolatopsis acidiphila]TVT17176.1 Lrp/AsnC family transcriptional regulator [Amycolatopsis acidiphila]UIJ63063.1 Lrp/AsnC family transcriptional regulator [Amycolatopsis acidiphila]GHG65923.1 AsnC family transcriptional regulator [Amycolatopsis acidiphila]
MARELDATDLAMLRLLTEVPRAGVREFARRLGVARGTAQARLDRLIREGVVAGFQPQISPAAMGFTGLAYVHVHLAQGRLEESSLLLAKIPEILELNSIAGEGDLICQVVARDNPGLEAVLQRIIETPGVVRTRAEIVLRRRIEPRIRPLIDALAEGTA